MKSMFANALKILVWVISIYDKCLKNIWTHTQNWQSTSSGLSGFEEFCYALKTLCDFWF